VSGVEKILHRNLEVTDLQHLILGEAPGRGFTDIQDGSAETADHRPFASSGTDRPGKRI
jgi:hypothetical protein